VSLIKSFKEKKLKNNKMSGLIQLVNYGFQDHVSNVFYIPYRRIHFYAEIYKDYSKTYFRKLFGTYVGKISILENIFNDNYKDLIIYYEKVIIRIDYKIVWIFSYSRLDKYTDIIEYSHSDVVKDLLPKYNVLRIETTKGVLLYSRERVIKHFYFLLKRLIERSKLYAEICGRPERLKRLHVFNNLN
jgi:hypothetical protein